ncbi:MAG: response regulator [Betaproteobacteria bacterium]|nr:response regulator [Betaproteobacteria bacterium]
MPRIMIVDDVASIRQIVTKVFQDIGYQVTEAARGEEALDLAKIKRVHLVITDVEMPGMSGLDLIKALRELKTYRTTPILILARDASDGNIKKAEALGASGFIEKPFTPERLVSVVNQVLVDAYVN